MHVKSVVSAFALSAAMLMSGAAIAQAQTETMMGDMTISAEDLPKVEERCTQLVTASTTESLTEESASTENDANAGAADATVENVEPVNEAADATATIDLDTITLEMCEAAGLGGAM
jgi:hypothetical protein